MKRKAKNKKKLGGMILIGLGFFLTIVLTFTTTLAWFYDSDWASKYVQMGGSVGIHLTNGEIEGEGGNAIPKVTSGSQNLDFKISTAKAFPGQAVDVNAAVYNNGGKSKANGSPCYVRAHFAVYTNIGKPETINPNDYVTPEYTDGTQNPAYADAVAKAEADANKEKDMSAEVLYAFLKNLITSQNEKPGATYKWVYYQHTGATPLSKGGTSTSDVNYYLDGKQVKDATHDNANANATSVTDVTTAKDKGYFYLCNPDGTTLQQLTVGTTAALLWDGIFIIPWTLENSVAEKYIYVVLSFQAIQTFIPKMNENGTIFNEDLNNQLPTAECTFNKTEVQTVFNSCAFIEPVLTQVIDGETINFGDSTKFDVVNK